MDEKEYLNDIYLVGEMVSELTYSHTVFGEGFYLFDLSVQRLSGKYDILPVLISERILDFYPVYKGDYFAVSGQIRSYNKKLENEKCKLVITVFAKEIIYKDYMDCSRNSNETELLGYMCKEPVYRVTPLGREITDMLLAVNRSFGKSDYIPCIVWGRNAKFAGGFNTGDKIKVVGRLQSRDYEKHYENGDTEKRTAYEVSVSNIELIR